MTVFQEIATCRIEDASSWYDFCNLVAAAGSSEIVNSLQTPALHAAEQYPQRLIWAITRLRNSGVELLSRVPVKHLTAPPNHFSSLISTLKIYGAPCTADAVKKAAYLFWLNIENRPVTASAAASSTAPAPPPIPTPIPTPTSSAWTIPPTVVSTAVPPSHQLTEDYELSAAMASSKRPRSSSAVSVGLGAAALIGAIWYLKKASET